METTSLRADISCEHCQKTIERELGAMSGVHSVEVDIPRKHVKVAYDPNLVSPAEIVSKMDEEGYPVQSSS